MESRAQFTQPLVAIHDSEFTRALESQNATGLTPTGSGTTGKQWWPTDWHYFVMPESAKEALRSDGTRFAVVGDSNIIAGALLTNGLPKYPIVISLASEAIRDNEIAAFTNYVAAGGFLFIGSSSFTRNTNGTSRGDFAFANEMGIHMVRSALTNWGQSSTFGKVGDHRLTSHFPAGALTYRLPSSSDEIPFGTSPIHNLAAPHDVWLVTSSNATILAWGDTTPHLLIKPYGKGYFIYTAAMQPLIANGGYGAGMYAYVMLRRAIEWAFESSKLPVPKVSPWPYEYDAAAMVRHDLENLSSMIADIENSARFEYTNGAKGDYYFCTGTLREEMYSSYDTNAVIASLRRAMTNYGATIGPHNGGLRNPNNPSLVTSDYDYWHWGTDEALDVTPAGYSSGKSYAQASMLASFQNIESWLSGLMTNGMRVWCSPYFNATREDSVDIQSQLNVKITGERKLSPFPHWMFSTKTAGLRYKILSQPPSEWYGGTLSGQVAQSLEYHTSASMRAGVDFYYNLGGLVNFYTHSSSSGLGSSGPITSEYVTYVMNTNLHPRIWSQNAIGLYNWWLQRSNVQMSASYTTNGAQSIINCTISGSANSATAIELVLGGSNPPCAVEVFGNGSPAAANRYRLNGNVLKIRVGTSFTTVSVRYYPSSPSYQLFSERFDAAAPPALPAGWTTSSSGGLAAWINQSSVVSSIPSAASSAGATTVGTSDLISPPFVLPTGTAQVTFSHNYNFEAESAMVGNDGGVFEIKIGTGSFTDIVGAGGSFVSGAYTHTISSAFGSAISNRLAWSGNSGGFVTTTVELPASASGQTVQFRWRNASDAGTASVGWRVDNVTLNNRYCFCCVNDTNPPVLSARTDASVIELATLTVTNTATDADVGDVLYYSLQAPPTGAIISTNGIITWTPGAAYGNTTNTFTTVVVDSGGQSATNSFLVTVINVNSAPLLPTQANRTINELATLIVTNTAADPDIPADMLTYTLLTAPANAVISTNGIITWITTEANGPSTNIITTRVEDNGVPPLASTNTFTVIVSEVNTSPALQPQSDQIIDEFTTLTVTNAASDDDIPLNAITYQLINPPAGATINGSGVITWTPQGMVGPSTNLIRTVATDNGSPILRVTNTFNVVVNDTVPCAYVGSYTQNFDTVIAPVLPSGWTTTFSGGQTAWVTSTVTNDTSPNAAFTTNSASLGSSELVSPTMAIPLDGTILTFRHAYDLETQTSTIGFDAGVVEIKIGTNVFQDIIAAGGSFLAGAYTHTVSTTAGSPIAGRAAWSGNSGGFITTAINLPPSSAGQNIQLRWRCATDNGISANGWRVDSVSISNLVCTFNTAPVLPTQSSRTISELNTLLVTNTATDADPLTYSLENPPSGATIDTNGLIAWTPTEEQGPSTNTFITIVSDGSLSATNSFSVIVTETNSAPAFVTTPPNSVIAEHATFSVTNAATDSDLPANVLTYSLLNPPSGAVISSNGVIFWTPTEAQGPSTNTFITIVSDGSLSATNSFSVIVTETNSAPAFVATPSNSVIAEHATLFVTNAATDSDLPANVLTYSLLNPPVGAVVSSNGVIFWTPSEAQGPSTNTFITIVSDGLLNATNSFSVIVTETNSAPAFVTTPPNSVIAEHATLFVTNVATDSDLPTNVLTYSLLNPPVGAVVSSNGVISWTPSEAQGPSTNSFITIVSDGSLSATNSFSVIVTETNSAPVLASISDRMVHAGSLLVVPASVTDGDSPANQFNFTLGAPSPTTATINPTNGTVFWLTTDADVNTTNTFMVAVADDGTPPLGDSKSFIVRVVARPHIETITITNEIATVTWTSIAGQNYWLQKTPSLNTPAWADTSSEVLATGSTATQTNITSGAKVQFYRVRLSP